MTDDAGATSSDTLRVHVDPSDGPSVTLNGPSSVTVGELAGFSASVSAGSVDLTAVTWRLDGSRLNRTTVSGDSAVADHGHVFTDDGDYTLTAVVVDRLGRERSQSTTVTVVEPSDVSDGGGGGGGGGGGASGSGGDADCYYPDDSVFSCEADSVTSNNGTAVTISDSDRDGNVTVNGETLSVMEGDTVTINQSTWEDHYLPNQNDSNNRDGGMVHYESGIEQGANDDNAEYINDWVVTPNLDRSSTERGDDDSGDSWTGQGSRSDSNSASESSLPDTVPTRVRENIERLRDVRTDRGQRFT